MNEFIVDGIESRHRIVNQLKRESQESRVEPTLT